MLESGTDLESAFPHEKDNNYYKQSGLLGAYTHVSTTTKLTLDFIPGLRIPSEPTTPQPTPWRFAANGGQRREPSIVILNWVLK